MPLLSCATALAADFGLVAAKINGIVLKVMAATTYNDCIHPTDLINTCIKGENTTCPNEPPAFKIPVALPRICGVMCCATAPINTEKLPMPEPMAVNTPKLTIKPKELVHIGAMSKPKINTTMPIIKMGREP